MSSYHASRRGQPIAEAHEFAYYFPNSLSWCVDVDFLSNVERHIPSNILFFEMLALLLMKGTLGSLVVQCRVPKNCEVITLPTLYPVWCEDKSSLYH